MARRNGIAPATAPSVFAGFTRCAAIFGATAERTNCDFFPRRFRLPQVTPTEGH